MNVISFPIKDLVSPEKNVRIHSEKQINEFIRSIEKFGQIRPAVIDENNVILVGNGMIEALKRLGRESVFVYQLCNLSENDKKKLMIADNKIFSLGIDNLDTLNSLLEELRDDLDIPGFDDDILASMVESSSEVSERLSNYGVLDERKIQNIKANAEKKAEPAPVETVSEHKESVSDSAETEEQKECKTDIQVENDFVICPKCGEKIWL